MLTINDLDITCRRDLRTVVSRLSLTLGAGERCAVVGEEGTESFRCELVAVDER